MNIGFDGTIRRPTNGAMLSAPPSIDPRIASDVANATKGAGELFKSIGNLGTSIYKLGTAIRETDFKVDSAKMRVDYAQRMEGVRAEMANGQYADVDSYMKAFEEKEAEARRGVLEAAKGTDEHDGYFRNVRTVGGRIDEEMEFLRGNAYLSALKSWNVRQRTQHYAELDAGYQTAMQLGADGGGVELMGSMVEADDRIPASLKEYEKQRRVALLNVGRERATLDNLLSNLTSDAHAQQADAVWASPDATYEDFEKLEAGDIAALDAQYANAAAAIEERKKAALEQMEGNKSEHAAMQRKAIEKEYDNQLAALAGTREASIKTLRTNFASIKTRGKALDKEEAERILRGEQKEATRRNVRYILDAKNEAANKTKSEKEKKESFLNAMAQKLPALNAGGKAGLITKGEDGVKFISRAADFVPRAGSSPEEAFEQYQDSRLVEYKRFFLLYDYEHGADMEELGDALRQAHEDLTAERYAQVFGVFRDGLLKKESKVPTDIVKNTVGVLEAKARDYYGVPTGKEKNNAKWTGDAKYLPARNLIGAYAENMRRATDIMTFNQLKAEAETKLGEFFAQEDSEGQIERMTDALMSGDPPAPLFTVPVAEEDFDLAREERRLRAIREGRPYDDDALDDEIESEREQREEAEKAQREEAAAAAAETERAHLVEEAKALGVKTEGRDAEELRKAIAREKLYAEAREMGVPLDVDASIPSGGAVAYRMGVDYEPGRKYKRKRDDKFIERDIARKKLEKVAKELGISITDEDGDLFDLDELRGRIEDYKKMIEEN